MIRTCLLVSFFSLVFLYTSAQESEQNMVKIYGNLYNAKDSSTVSATIFYEKLPYYDDMGVLLTNPDGSFEFTLVAGNKYSIKIDNVPGFKSFNKQLIVPGTTDEQLSDFYLSPQEDEEVIRLDNLNFSRGSATITESSYSVLDEFINFINARPNVDIQLEGHTDFAGDAEANMELSRARVEAVAEYIIKNGVNKNKVKTRAFGGSQPISTERTDEARAANRRVEVRLIKKN